jgi:hypothetical protein
MRVSAYIYTCRNPGQVALLWAHQPPPFGHGWIDVKRVGLVREDEVEALRRERDEWRSMVGSICATIPLGDVLSSTSTGQNTVDYFKQLHAEIATLRREVRP